VSVHIYYNCYAYLQCVLRLDSNCLISWSFESRRDAVHFSFINGTIFTRFMIKWKMIIVFNPKNGVALKLCDTHYIVASWYICNNFRFITAEIFAGLFIAGNLGRTLMSDATDQWRNGFKSITEKVELINFSMKRLELILSNWNVFMLS